MSLQIIEMKVADLVPYAMNAKQHPAEQVMNTANKTLKYSTVER